MELHTSKARAGRGRWFRGRRGLAALAGIALLGLLLLDTGRAGQPERAIPSLAGERAGLVGVPDGQAAPDFSVKLFDGATFRLAEQRGRAVVLNFWASWCPPCRAEMPYFETTYRAYRERGVDFVGVTVQDDQADSQAFLKELSVSYPSGADEGNQIALRYQLTGLPTTVFINRDGIISRKWIGAISERQLLDLVEELAR